MIKDMERGMLPALDTLGWQCPPAPPPTCCQHPLDELGTWRWVSTGVCCPSPVSLYALSQQAPASSGMGPFPEYPWVPRGCSSSGISSVLVVGQVLPQRWRSSDSGKDSLSQMTLALCLHHCQYCQAQSAVTPACSPGAPCRENLPAAM